MIMDASEPMRPVGGARQQPAAIRPFFEQLGERCQQIEAVAMDMNTAFDLGGEATLPAGGGWSTTCSTWWLAMAEGGGPGASGAGECTEKR